MTLFNAIAANSVQPISYDATELQHLAERLGQHFLFADCHQAVTKSQILAAIANGFGFPAHFGRNLDALYDCLTDLPLQAGLQPGFVIVLAGLPDESSVLLNVFEDAAEFWAAQKIPFRVFYSVAV
jgi:RNAse (barnase) inhibitor barstar